MKQKQVGFTLIELMISLTLGLIVTAAAILLFLTGQRSVAMQKGVAELQDNANFGLNYITKDIRLANLNNKEAIINDSSLHGGVVLTSVDSSFVYTKDTIKYPNLPTGITGLADTLLTQGNGLTTVGSGTVWTGVSNVTNVSGAALSSDQLVIQYVPQYIVDKKNTPTDESDDELVGGFDCEGNELRFAKTAGLQVIVQRYFLRTDNNKARNEGSPLALACDAGYYSFDGVPTSIQRYGDAGEIIMKRVDHFRVLLGVESIEIDNSTSTPVTSIAHQYLSIANYMAKSAPRPRIQSIQLGALVRSTQALGADAAVKADQEFQLLDQTVKVKASTDPKYIRQVVSQTIALRNALGERK